MFLAAEAGAGHGGGVLLADVERENLRERVA
jgi:hypothetical protein